MVETLSEPADVGPKASRIKSFFFFWTLFGVIVGTPSLLAIFQAVFLKRDFIQPLQSLIEGWNELTDTLSAVVEPMATPLISWVESLTGVDLVLQQHWKHLFIVMATLVVAIGRNAASHYGARQYIALTLRLFVVLVASLISGLIPLNEDRFVQAALASILPWAVFGLAAAKRVLGRWPTLRDEKILTIDFWYVTFILGPPLLGFWIINTVSVALLMPYLGEGAAIVALAICTFVVALWNARDPEGRSIIYSVAGGYVGAAILVGTEWALRASIHSADIAPLLH